MLSEDYEIAKNNLIEDYPKPALLGDVGQQDLKETAIKALNREVKLFISENGRRPTEAEYIRIVDSIVDKAYKAQKNYADYKENKKAEAKNRQDIIDNAKATSANN